MRVSVIGNHDLVTGFGLVGIKDLYAVKQERAPVEDTFRELSSDKEIGVIIIPHSYADLIRDSIKRVNDTKKIIPIIVEVPDAGEEAIDFDPFEDLIKKAVGVNI